MKEFSPPANADDKTKPAEAGKSADLKFVIKTQLLSKYLHLVISGWWKDPGGIHFDGFIE